MTEKVTKESEQLVRDFEEYRQWMFAKAIRQGMTPDAAHRWAEDQVQLQKRAWLDEEGKK